MGTPSDGLVSVGASPGFEADGEPLEAPLNAPPGLPVDPVDLVDLEA